MTRSDTRFRPREILGALHRHEVRYVLIGGLAAGTHGSPTTTVDVDICPETSRENMERLRAALRSLGARIREPDGRRGRRIDLDPDLARLSEVWTLVTRFGDLDVCLLPTGTEGYADLVRSATTVVVRGIPVVTASLADVIRSKEAAGRPKDLAVLETLGALLAHERKRSHGKRSGRKAR